MKRFLKTLLLGSCALSVGLTSLSPVQEVQAAEEKITVYMPSPAGLADKIAAGFEEETGIKVDLFQGTTGEITARLESEKSNPIADVVILASWTDGLNLKNQDMLASYEADFIDNVVEGWVDEDNTLFGYSASAVGVLYNTDIFDEIDVDWDGFSDEKFKDELAIPDPEKSGAAKDFVSGYVEEYGWDNFQAMADNGMIVPGANKAALEAVMTGEVGVLIGGVDYNAYKSIDEGEPLAIYYPAGGTIVNPRPAMIMKDAPNPELAQQFMDYLFCDEVQEMIKEAYLLPGNKNIEVDNRTSLDEIPQITPKWDAMMEHASDDAAKINEICQ